MPQPRSVPSFRRCVRLAAVIALAWASPAVAQSPTADPLEALVAEGLRANLGLRAATLEQRRVALDVRRADAALLPTLDVDARYSEFSGVFDIGDAVNPAYAALNRLLGSNEFPTDISVTIPFRQDMRVRLTQPLFVPAAYAGRALARAERARSEAGLQRTVRTLDAGIRLAWLGAAGAARAVGIWDATLAVLDENLRVAERLVRAGSATPDAVHRARADRAEAAQSRAEAQRDADEARRALNELVRRPLDAPLDPAPEALPADADSLPSLDLLLARARGAREELAEAASGERAAQAGERAASAGYLPTIAVTGDYGVQGSSLRFSGENDFAAVSVVLQWNLFRGGADATRRSQARIQREQAAVQRAAIAQQVEREVRDAHAAAATAEAVVAAADERLAAAARTLELIRRRYEEGLAPHLEFTDARAAWTRAGLSAVIARVSRAARRVALDRAAAVVTLPTLATSAPESVR